MPVQQAKQQIHKEMGRDRWLWENLHAYSKTQRAWTRVWRGFRERIAAANPEQLPVIYCYGMAGYSGSSPGDELTTPNKRAFKECQVQGGGDVAGA